MKIEKTFTVDAPQSAVWAFITDPRSVAPCIPGCESAERVDDTHFKAKVALAIGPIKTAFSVDIEQTEVQAPERAVYQIKGDEGSQASRVKSTSSLALKALGPAQTEVHYVSEVTIVGRLGKFGSGMVQKKADSIGDEFVAQLREHMAAVGEPATAAAGTAVAADSVGDVAANGSGPMRWLLAGLAAMAAAYALISWLGNR